MKYLLLFSIMLGVMACDIKPQVGTVEVTIDDVACTADDLYTEDIQSGVQFACPDGTVVTVDYDTLLAPVYKELDTLYLETAKAQAKLELLLDQQGIEYDEEVTYD